MTTQERLFALVSLGNNITKGLNEGIYQEVFHRAQAANPWFTPENCERSLDAISKSFLTASDLGNVIDTYCLNNFNGGKRVGIVMAGNIPAVGMHDLISTFLCGHIAHIKLSSKDATIIPYLIRELITIDKRCEPYFEVVERLNSYHAVIATGGNNTSRYFQYYFRDVPHLIRKSRTGVAILQGNENNEDFLKLGDDMMAYFGLGCRNVSKLYVPENYDFSPMLDALAEFAPISNHHKYRNNYDYSLALYLINKENVLQGEAMIMRPSESLASRISVIHYEEYSNFESLIAKINAKKDEIQCVISPILFPSEIPVFNFGEAQKPSFTDYADGVDTIQFLMSVDG